MAIGPVTDAYIDSVVNANDPYNPNLNKTQGVQLRALLKQLSGRLEQQTQAGALQGLVSLAYADLAALVASEGLAPGQLYLLADYQTVYQQPVTNNILSGQTEPLILQAISPTQFAGQAISTLYPDDQIIYDFNNNMIVTTPAVPGWYNLSVETDQAVTDQDLSVVNFFVVLTSNNRPVMVSEQGNSVQPPQTAQVPLSDSSINVSVMTTTEGGYAGNYFRLLINGVEYDIEPEDVPTFAGDFTDLPVIATVTGNVCVQVYAKTQPTYTPLPDDSAGTPGTGTNRNGFIFYREDNQGNSAYFDWRGILFRRYAVDTTSIPAWATGGSYAQYSLVTYNGAIYGLTAEVDNDPNSSLDMSPASAYMFICGQGIFILPNLKNRFGPFNALSGDTSNFLDTAAIDGLGTNVKIQPGSQQYLDNLPNVACPNGVTECEVKADATDVHVDACSYMTIGQNCSGSVYVNTGFSNIGADAAGQLLFNSSGVSTSDQLSSCVIVQSSNVTIGSVCNNLAMYNSDSIAIGDSCQNTQISFCTNIKLGSSGSGNTLQNCQNTDIGFNCQGNILTQSSVVSLEGGNNANQVLNAENIKIGLDAQSNTLNQCEGVSLAAGASTNNLLNSSDVEIGTGSSGNVFTQASGLTIGIGCNNNNQINPASVAGIVFEDNSSFNTLSGTNDQVRFGLNASYNTVSGTGIAIGAESSNNNLSGNDIELGAGCSSNTVNAGCSGIIFQGSNTTNTIQANSYSVELGIGANSNTVSGTNIIIGNACSSNNISGTGIALRVNSDGNTVGAGSVDIVFAGGNSSNTVGTSCAGIEFGVGATDYQVGNNVVNCYFRSATGEDIPDGSSGLVPWSSTPTDTFTPGSWTDVENKTTDIENETSPIQYKVDGTGPAAIVYIGGQFSIQPTFEQSSITLGTVGATAIPVAEITKYITVLDPVSGDPLGILLSVDTSGNLSLSTIPGSSENLPNTPTTLFFIDIFYKPTITVYTYTKTASFTTEGCTPPLVGSQVSYSKTYDSYISEADAENNIAAADADNFNAEGQAYANENGTCLGYAYNVEVVLTEIANTPSGDNRLNVGIVPVGQPEVPYYFIAEDLPFNWDGNNIRTGTLPINGEGSDSYQIVALWEADEGAYPTGTYAANGGVNNTGGVAFKVAINGTEYVIEPASVPTYMPTVGTFDNFVIATIDLYQQRTLTVQMYATTQPAYTPLPDISQPPLVGSIDLENDMTNGQTAYLQTYRNDEDAPAPIAAAADSGGTGQMNVYADIYNIALETNENYDCMVAYNGRPNYPVPICAGNHVYLYKTGQDSDQSWWLDLPGFETGFVVANLDTTQFPAAININNTALADGIQVEIQIEDQTEGIGQNWSVYSNVGSYSATIMRAITATIGLFGSPSGFTGVTVKCNGTVVTTILYGNYFEATFSPGDTWEFDPLPA